MRTVGECLKEARTKKKYSLRDLEAETKIKAVFLEAIEKDDWDLLPDYPVVMGFVRNVSLCLGLEPEKMLAFLRRDYPPKGLSINPKPDVSKTFVWNPKLTFLVSTTLVAVALLAYLLYQYLTFVRPPAVEIAFPQENQLVESRQLEVRGRTDPEATLTINNQPVLLEENGQFVTEIEVAEKTEEIEVIARSRAGKETIIKRKIEVKLK